jgi:general secretion pathway protein K
MTGRDRRRGMVLVMVLWSIALLSAFAGIAAIGRDRVQGEALFTAGLEIAAAMVRGSDGQPLTDTETTVNLSTGAVRARLNDEGGRIDVGKAPKEVLAALLRAVGAPEVAAEDAAQRIVQWRNRDNAGPPGTPAPQGNLAIKDQSMGQPFADVLEIAQVPGVAPQWVAAMAPLTTVFGAATVNPLTAPADVIAALPGVDRVQLAAFLALRRASPNNAEGISAALGPAQRFLAEKREQVVGVELAAMLPDGYAAAARAVIVLMAQDTQPYRILVWKPLPSSTLR